MDLTSPDFNGRPLPIAGSPHHHLLAHRNFAVIKMCDSSGKDWDANDNLWVEIFAELDTGIRKLPQSLLGVERYTVARDTAPARTSPFRLRDIRHR